MGSHHPGRVRRCHGGTSLCSGTNDLRGASRDLRCTSSGYLRSTCCIGDYASDHRVSERACADKGRCASPCASDLRSTSAGNLRSTSDLRSTSSSNLRSASASDLRAANVFIAHCELNGHDATYL